MVFSNFLKQKDSYVQKFNNLSRCLNKTSSCEKSNIYYWCKHASQHTYMIITTDFWKYMRHKLIFYCHKKEYIITKKSKKTVYYVYVFHHHKVLTLEIHLKLPFHKLQDIIFNVVTNHMTQCYYFFYLSMVLPISLLI